MDLDSLFKRAFDGFGSDPEPAGFPGFPGNGEASGNGQTIANVGVSRISRISRSEKEVLGSDQNSTPKNASDFSAYDRAREDLFKTPGNPGKGVKTPAETDTSLFPERDSVPGNPGKMSAQNGRLLLDLNRAAPQRSDWWTGPAMAEVEALAPPAGDSLPISAAEVHAGVARELRHLAGLGVVGSEAERRAVAITAAKIRNAPALAERQPNPGRCHACGDPLDGSRPEIAVMNPGGSGLHMHGDGACHGIHRARKATQVGRIMAAAGYSLEEAKLCA